MIHLNDFKYNNTKTVTILLNIIFCKRLNIDLVQLFLIHVLSSCPPDAQKMETKLTVNTGQVMFSGDILYY